MVQLQKKKNYGCTYDKINKHKLLSSKNNSKYFHKKKKKQNNFEVSAAK